MGKVDVHPNRGYRSGGVRMQPKSDGDGNGDARTRRGKSLLSGKKSTFLEQHHTNKGCRCRIVPFQSLYRPRTSNSAANEPCKKFRVY